MTRFHGAAVALIFAGLAAMPATAQEAKNPAPTAGQPMAADPFGTGDALDETALGKVTGREDIAMLAARSTQQTTVANSSVTGNSVTGAVQIDGNAFQNLQGLAVISANSGNNVAISSSMNVTINLAPR